MVFISKMVPTANGGRFVAFGRVFSGTLTQGQKVRILGPEYVAGSQKDVYHAIMMGNIEAVNECSAGDVIGKFTLIDYKSLIQIQVKSISIQRSTNKYITISFCGKYTHELA